MTEADRDGAPRPSQPTDQQTPEPGPRDSGVPAGAGQSAGDPSPPDAEQATEHVVDGPPATDPDVAADVPADVAADLVLAEATVAALTEDLQRLQAEYLNYKRRVERDRQLVKENATFSVLSAMLPVLDDLDRAREHGELEGGFKAVADALERLVAAQGLEKFGQPGDAFDPRLHEALMHSYSSEVTTTTAANVVSAGYRIGERVVRPARVTVVDPE